jgi:hypothetical protein
MAPLQSRKSDLARERQAAVEREAPNVAWLPASDAPNDVEILTKIDDSTGGRNICTLKRNGHLWFIPDGSMYVYYTPTHFAYIS